MFITFQHVCFDSLITGDVIVNSGERCYRSATQESALVISLQMFNLVLERFIKVLQDHINGHAQPNSLPLPHDCVEMLPALKVRYVVNF